MVSSLQEHTDSNFFNQKPYVLLRETSGAGSHVSK